MQYLLKFKILIYFIMHCDILYLLLDLNLKCFINIVQIEGKYDTNKSTNK